VRPLLRSSRHAQALLPSVSPVYPSPACRLASNWDAGPQPHRTPQARVLKGPGGPGPSPFLRSKCGAQYSFGLQRPSTAVRNGRELRASYAAALRHYRARHASIFLIGPLQTQLARSSAAGRSPYSSTRHGLQAGGAAKALGLDGLLAAGWWEPSGSSRWPGLLACLQRSLGDLENIVSPRCSGQLMPTLFHRFLRRTTSTHPLPMSTPPTVEAAIQRFSRIRKPRRCADLTTGQDSLRHIPVAPARPGGTGPI